MTNFKKHAIILLLSIGLVSGCTSNKNSGTPHEETPASNQTSSSVDTKNQKLDWNDQELVNACDAFVKYLSVEATQDNYIEAISNKFKEKPMSQKTYEDTKKIISNTYLPQYNRAMKETALGKKDLKTKDFNNKTLMNYFKVTDDIMTLQEEWSTEMVNFTKENAYKLPEKIKKNQTNYNQQITKADNLLIQLFIEKGYSKADSEKIAEKIFDDTQKEFDKENNI